MKKVTQIHGKVVPLKIKDVDTDLIIPAQYLTSVSREGYGEHLFQRLKASDPNFVFNQPRYQDAKILIAEDNFGCGSSREHAVWALQGAGLEAILAPSFADIFFNNSAKNGLLLVALPEEVIAKLLTQALQQELTLTIDVAEQTVKTPTGEAYHFSVDPFQKHCFINGLDELDYILSYKNEIQDFRANQPFFVERTRD
jgi:3-isopropylmalate/(R)-2-methylmalate dehydratase small subunit